MSTNAEFQARADKLNAITDELLSLDLQMASCDDHIHVAEGLLSLYEKYALLTLDAIKATGRSFKDEGTLVIFRHAAELHLRIAEAKR